jgi:hypothetical protein
MANELPPSAPAVAVAKPAAPTSIPPAHAPQTRTGPPGRAPRTSWPSSSSGALTYAGKLPSEVSLILIALLTGVRMSDVATVRKSNGNGGSGPGGPPIAGGLMGALFAMLSGPHG